MHIFLPFDDLMDLLSILNDAVVPVGQSSHDSSAVSISPDVSPCMRWRSTALETVRVCCPQRQDLLAGLMLAAIDRERQAMP